VLRKNAWYTLRDKRVPSSQPALRMRAASNAVRPCTDVSCIEHFKYEIAATMSQRHRKVKSGKKGDA
jgi:hypothetical protein